MPFPTADIEGCAGAIPGANVNAPPIKCLTPVINVAITYAFFFLGAICLFFLFQGAIKYIISKGEPKVLAEAKMTIIYALLGAAFVLSAYIIINFFQGTFGKAGLNLLDFKL